jgi:hypothetical protein
MSSPPGRAEELSDSEPILSKRARIVILTAALLWPWVCIGAGVAIAVMAGWDPVAGAFTGGIASALAIGAVWIVLGGRAMATELRDLRKHRDGPEG